MRSKATRRVLIMAGGTGGHVIPALSLAKTLGERDVGVEWLGSPRGIENRLVPEAGIVLHRVAVSGLRGNGIVGWLSMPWHLSRAVWQAYRVIANYDPQLVVGLGGFASGPGGIAAWLMRRPLVIHEQNALAGLTNRVLARLARRVYVAFPGALPGNDAVQVIGNPVRQNIAALGEVPRTAASMRKRRLRLLVVGGSLGALALNRYVPVALGRLDEMQRPQVLHQAGRDKDAAARQAYTEQGVEAEIVAFIDDMASAYDWADLVVCRAGALTVSELAAAAKPALLVPYPHAVDDHQTANARVLLDAKAAQLMPQADLSAERLGERLAILLDPDTLAGMASNARANARLDASERLANGCMEIGFEQ